jgi:hypothetical protein
MKVEFIAVLQGASCIKFDDDGASSVKFTQDGGQLPQVVKLTLFQGKRLKVTIEEAK